MFYYAHTAETATGEYESDKSQWQLLSEHLSNVAERTEQFAAPFGLADEARLAGLLHDVGKYGKRFQHRLENSSIKGINHWAHGAFAAWQSSRMCAFAVDGHHTGIPAARRDDDKIRCLANTLKDFKSGGGINPNTNIAESLETLLERSRQDGLTIPTISQKEQFDFATALRTRMLFSCLADADFLDTENHFDPEQAKSRSVPSLAEETALETVVKFLQGLPIDGQVNQARRQLLSDCLAAAEMEPGLFSLTAPTGSGKTLASIAFALKHCCRHNASLPAASHDRFRRIIVVIPFTSIIEQTAKVFSDLFKPVFGPDYVLEHHSAVAWEELDSVNQDAEDAQIRRARLAAENWSSPLVVTTSVQFFESLFAHRPSRCRKLHNIARSVVIFDEVQTLPPRLVPSLLSAVNCLTRDYGVTAVFCTATQPAFGTAAKAIDNGWQPREISSRPGAMAETLKRTTITIRSPEESPADWQELASEISQHNCVLCVVNTRTQATELFQLLPEEGCFHLSAAMCTAHRSDKLAVIRQRLKEKETCRLISTQLIEAGVDVDFPIAYRALGPLDSIIQTAGRCNREGHLPDPGSVTVFTPPSGGMPRGAYKTAAQETESFLAEFPDVPLHQPETYQRYFARLYEILGPDSKDKDCAYQASKDFDFPAAANACRLIDDETRSVLVPYGYGGKLIETIRHQQHLTADLARRCQRFTINLYESEFQKSRSTGVITPLLRDESMFFWSSSYDDQLGAGNHEAEQFVL